MTKLCNAEQMERLWDAKFPFKQNWHLFCSLSGIDIIEEITKEHTISIYKLFDGQPSKWVVELANSGLTTKGDDLTETIVESYINLKKGIVT